MKEFFFKLSTSFNQFLLMIDNFLENRSRREVYILYLIPTFLVFFLSIEFLTPMTEKLLEESKINLRALNKKIGNYKNSLSLEKNTETIIEILKKENISLTQKIQKEIDNNYFIEAKIENELIDIKYNREKWSNYLYNLTKNATNFGILINNLSNERNEESKVDTFSHVMSIDFNGTGEFTGVMKFLDSLERDKKFSEITSLQLEGSREIDFSIDVAVWGIR